MALWEFWFLLDGSRLKKRRGVYKSKQSKSTKVKSKSTLDMLPKVKENHIDSISDFLNRNSLVRYGKSYKKCKQRNQSLILQIILHFRDNQVSLKNILLCVTSGSLMQILFSQKLCVVPRSFPVIKNGSKNMNGLYIHQY